MRIDRVTANKIVERMSKVVNHNINVIDKNGIIIAAGDKTRIGTKHEGALIVLERKEVLEINESSTHTYRGVKPGINLPITIDEKVIGVIGITGNPDEIRGYADLVRIATELFIEQDLILDEANKTKQSKSNFILSLINDKNNDYYTMIINKNIWNFEREYFSINILSINDIDNDISINSVFSILESFNITFYAMKEYNIIVFMTCGNKNEIKSKVDLLCIELNNKFSSFCLAAGKRYSDITMMSESYTSAKHILKVMENKAYVNCVKRYEDVLMELLIYNAEESWINIEFKEVWSKLNVFDKDGELEKTLIKYFENDCKSNETASALHIHRNTLTYRLERVYDITNRNPNKMSDLFILICACSLKR